MTIRTTIQATKIKQAVMIGLAAIGIVSGFSVTLPQAAAQEVLQKIEALVNDEIISRYDLDQRVRLIIAAGGGVETPEELERLNEEILRSMVDERLQLQEAATFELEVADEEIADAFRNIAQSFNQTPEEFGNFLIQAGSSHQTLFDQLRAEFAWQRLVQGRLGSQIVISDEDVEERLERMISNQGKYEYRMSEIYLIIDDPSRTQLVTQTATRILQQLRDGAQFALMAQQFSESSSAARGGDLGWVAQDQLAPELNKAIAEMKVGETAGPVVSGSGVYILSMTDRRRILSADPLDANVKLHGITYPFTAETTQEQAEAFLDLLEAETPLVTSCEQIPAMAERLGAPQYGELAEVSLRDINPQLRPLLAELETGHPSQPAVSSTGVQIFFICERSDPEVKIPTFDEVLGQLEQQRLAMMARRYLRDLRRDAIVEYK